LQCALILFVNAVKNFKAAVTTNDFSRKREFHISSYPSVNIKTVVFRDMKENGPITQVPYLVGIRCIYIPEVDGNRITAK
jgi:hypothetical protein